MKILKKDPKNVDRISKELGPDEPVLVEIDGVLHPCITSSEGGCRSCILSGRRCASWISHLWAAYALIPEEEILE